MTIAFSIPVYLFCISFCDDFVPPHRTLPPPPVIVAPSASPLRSSVVVASSSPATAAVAGAAISYAIPEEASVDASPHDSTGAGASVAAPKSVSRQGHTLTPISHPADGHHGISHAVRPPYLSNTHFHPTFLFHFPHTGSLEPHPPVESC
jgi:hypothetical protein